MIGKTIPSVSFIVPVHNAQDFLDTCLLSITKQSIKNIEILCIDDYSRDSSSKILQSWSQRDSRVKIITLKKHIGPGASRNLGVDAAKGKFIRMVDADDFLPADSTEKMLDTAEKYGSNLVRGGLQHYRHDGSFLKKGGRFPEKLLINGSFVQNRDLWFIDQHTSYLYTTDLIKKSGAQYDEKMLNGEDVVFLMKLAPFMKRVSLIPEPVYCYRRNPNSTMQGSKNIQYYRNLFHLYEMEYEFLTPQGFREQVDHFLTYHLAIILPKIVLPSLPIHLTEKEAVSILTILKTIIDKYEIKQLCFANHYPWKDDFIIPLLSRQIVALLSSGHIVEAQQTLWDFQHQRSKIRRQQKTIRAMRTSSSWKITAPLRFLANRFR